MKVAGEVQIYEIDRKEVPIGQTPSPMLRVESHWNRNGHDGLVHIIGPDGASYCVVASQLKRAIESCVGLK